MLSTKSHEQQHTLICELTNTWPIPKYQLRKDLGLSFLKWDWLLSLGNPKNILYGLQLFAILYKMIYFFKFIFDWELQLVYYHLQQSPKHIFAKLFCVCFFQTIHMLNHTFKKEFELNNPRDGPFLDIFVSTYA